MTDGRTLVFARMLGCSTENIRPLAVCAAPRFGSRGSEVGRDGFMKGCPNKALDKHPYHAWAPWGRVETYYKRSCSWADENRGIEDEVGTSRLLRR